MKLFLALVLCCAACAGAQKKSDDGDVTQEITTKNGTDVDANGRLGTEGSIAVDRCEGQTSDGQCVGSGSVEVKHTGAPTPPPAAPTR